MEKIIITKPDRYKPKGTARNMKTFRFDKETTGKLKKIASLLDVSENLAVMECVNRYFHAAVEKE